MPTIRTGSKSEASATTADLVQPTLDEAEAASAGTVRDFISGQPVRATKEEVQAVQVFLRRLVQDYGYEPKQIQAHPQVMVRERPSGGTQGYPVDIMVFGWEAKTESNHYIIVECKEPTRKSGIEQLKTYLRLSAATIGVWFNGSDHYYLWKEYLPGGEIHWHELPNIPRKDQRVQDVGLYRRSELKPPSNLKAVFRDIRNHLAGNVTGITRDETLAQEIINLLFCKLHDETFTAPEETVSFRAGVSEEPHQVADRINQLFDRVKQDYSDVLDANDHIGLDPESLTYVVGELQNYCLIEADRDAVAEAFEVFIGPALRGSEGQFFTPRNVVKMMVEILDPKPNEVVLDPACGSGGFLVVALGHVWAKMDEQAERFGWSAALLERRKRDVAQKQYKGVEKDAFLAKVTKAYMAIVGDGRGGVFCWNSLTSPADWPPLMRQAIELGTIDVIITNPPYGKKIKIKGQDILQQYDFGHVWKTNKATGELRLTDAVRDEQPPQLLFLERCLQLLKPGGRLGIVLPEAILGLPSYSHVTRWILERTKVLGVISMPESLFKTSGKGGTHTKVCVLFLENTRPLPGEDYGIFMADAKWCGHDSRGNPTPRRKPDGSFALLDDVATIARRYHAVVGASR